MGITSTTKYFIVKPASTHNFYLLSWQTLCNIVFKHKKGEKRKSGEKARLNPTPQHLPSLFSNSPEDACPFNAVARSPN